MTSVFIQLRNLILFNAYPNWCKSKLDKIVYMLSDYKYYDVYPDRIFPNYYQSTCRVYLDEYPEQKELREEWLEKDPFTYAKLLEMINALEPY